MGRAELRNACLAVGVVLILAATSACGRELPACSIDFAGYDAAGSSEPLRIVSVKQGQGGEADLEGREILGIDEHGYRVTAQGSTVYFTEHFLYGFTWGVTLESLTGMRVEKPIGVWSCTHQRESVFFLEEQGSDPDSAPWFERDGRLVGCEFDGDWWVRFSPYSIFRMGPTQLSERLTTAIWSRLRGSSRFSRGTAYDTSSWPGKERIRSSCSRLT